MDNWRSNAETVILAENISKLYHIGLQKQVNRTFREALTYWLASPIRNFKRIRQLTRFEEFGHFPVDGKVGGHGAAPYQNGIIWGLKNVSFEVKRGEVVGIIGRNGSGKSTLLKVLSRITEPTSGEARIYGSTSSILEVGTGFHPELTGRDNIFLNGTILGMKKTQIEKRFDEIVSFAEMDKFIDTPVKHYSSGMYVRLAFSLVAHLESEILMIDEVLAVGDLAFQNKCLGKMESIARGGRTILFVTHSLGTAERLCSRAILLDGGSIIAEGKPFEVIRRYLQQQFAGDDSKTSLLDHPGRRDGSEVIMREIRLYANGKESKVFCTGDSLKIEVSFKRSEPIIQMHFGIVVEGAGGQRLVPLWSSDQAPHLIPERISKGTITCQIPCLHLLPGLYFLTILIRCHDASRISPHPLDCIDQAVRFTVQAADVFNSGYALDAEEGVFFEEGKWDLEAT
jgi:lipopolysaccharide transport system ATP-binding protein